MEKLEMEELNCLSELGKYSRQSHEGFNERITGFFWDIIMSEDSKNLELIEKCTENFKEMSMKWNNTKRLEIYQNIVDEINSP